MVTAATVLLVKLEDVKLRARAQRKVLECSTKLNNKLTDTIAECQHTLLINISDFDIHLQ